MQWSLEEVLPTSKITQSNGGTEPLWLDNLMWPTHPTRINFDDLISNFPVGGAQGLYNLKLTALVTGKEDSILMSFVVIQPPCTLAEIVTLITSTITPAATVDETSSPEIK